MEDRIIINSNKVVFSNLNSFSKSGDTKDIKSELSNSFQEIIDRKRNSEMSGKSFVKTLDNVELSIIQQAKLMAGPIQIELLTEEGAENLFVIQGDNRQYVDLNNDGITEIGQGRSLIFPPPNTSDLIKDAWDETSKDMSFKERMLVMGQFLGLELSHRSKNQINQVSSSIYGETNENFIHLIDKIIVQRKKYDQLLPLEHRKKSKFIVSAMETLKDAILNRLK